MLTIGIRKQLEGDFVIIDLPTLYEYERHASNLLNLAWSIGVEIEHELHEAKLEQWDEKGVVTDEYWRVSQPALGNGVALVQQAQEMALKGKIAAISAYLLISHDPRDWPKGCEGHDVLFSAFRTVDAADLIRIFNTVCDPTDRLDEAFKRFFEDTREQRNAIIHAGGDGRRIQVAELLLGVLRTNEYLLPEIIWPVRRRYYLENDRISVAYSPDHVGSNIVWEFEAAVRILKPADSKHFFDLTKARRYLCPVCNHEEGVAAGHPVALAQLSPNSPSSTRLECFVCGSVTAIERSDCLGEECKSNVICDDPSWGRMCMVCGMDQDRMLGSD